MSLLVTVDLNWILQFIVTVLIVAVGLLHLVKNTASNYFLADDTDHDNDDVSDWPATTTAVTPPTTVKTTTAAINNNTVSRSEIMATVTTKAVEEDSCAVCGCQTTKWCAGCKIVKYCSGTCQTSHWKSVHKTECKDFQLFGKSIIGRRRGSSAISLVASGESSKSSNQLKKILFPYENFVKFFNWDKPGFPPCGLLNCGNSCFANAVLQCLAYTKPLVAFLLETGHRRECRRNDWCFLCEFQTHVERANQSLRPFSPINILSRLPNIGGNLGYGKQEDAHEFMRFAIDTMQSVCLDEFGGEKAIHPTSQETTLIQHIFGGHLQSQVICTKCNNISNQFENMMDLTVEIQGDAASLEDCLDQFTAKEWLHGDNMYKCDGCDDYVMAWKRLTVRRAPNILTIALKRFQSGRFGKLNKRVTFPETLDLSPYMSETAEDENVYKLYAVIVHVDMLNASFFGHYICYIKDFRGKWYRVDDCKVIRVDLDEVLSQGAYMLLYSRISARRSCLYPAEPPRKEELQNMEVDLSATHPVQCPLIGESADTLVNSVIYTSDSNSQSEVAICEVELSSRSNCENTKEDLEMVDLNENCPVSLDDELCEGSLPVAIEEAAVPLGHTHALASTNVPMVAGYLSEVDIIKEIPSSPVSNVLDDSGGSNRNLPYFSLRDSSDQDPLATQNHVDVKEEMPCDVSAAVSSSTEILEESRTADSRDKTGKAAREMPFSHGIPSSNGFQEKARKSDGKKSVAKINPVFRRGFLDRKLVATKNPVDLKEEMRLHLSAAVSSANEALEGAKTADSRDKTGKAAPGMLSSDGVTSSNGLQDTARKSDGRSSAAKVKPISHPGFFEKDSVATQNHVDVKEEMPADVHAAISSSNEVLVETKTADSRDKTGKAAREIPSTDGVPASNGFRDSARKSDRKHSAVKVKPLFHPGFLDKRPQNKHIKREREISAEQISGSNIHCQVNEVCKPNLSGQIDVAMTNGDKGHLGYYNGISADVLGRRDELIEKNTPMEMDTTENNEPSSILYGGSGK